MKIICETSIVNFEWWAGAKDNASRFTYDELESIESMLEDCFGDEGLTDTQLNDIMWFEPETFCEWLGIDFEEWLERE